MFCIRRRFRRCQTGQRPTIFGDGEQSRDFTYVDNAVEANLLACKASAPQVAGKAFNVATGRRVTLNATFKLLQTLTSYSGSPIYGAERSGDIKHSLADISAAKEQLGYRPRVGFEMASGRRLTGIEPMGTTLALRAKPDSRISRLRVQWTIPKNPPLLGHCRSEVSAVNWEQLESISVRPLSSRKI